MDRTTEKRILVLSNECFSQNTSNGRTISVLLREIQPEHLAQFYLHGTPDQSICSNYFHVSDEDALNALLCRRPKTTPAAARAETTTAAPKTVQPAAQIPAQQANKRQSGDALRTVAENRTTAAPPMRMPAQKPRKTCKNIVLRDLVWRSNRWWKSDFTKFLREFHPDVVLLQAGDSPFMYAIARRIAKKFRARLVMFNTENYVLKQKLYSGAKERSFWHLVLRHRLRVQYRRFMKRADFCVYNTEWLEKAYLDKYSHAGKSAVLYGSTEYEFAPSRAAEDRFDVTYCGNLGVGRTAPLYEFACVLREVIPEARLHIYGRFPTLGIQNRFTELPNLIYHGVVPYEQVRGILSSSAMVLHCENSQRLEDLRFAFSTKIADCLACGRPLLVYASRDYPFVQYLEQYHCAHIAADRQELAELLQRCKDRAFCDGVIADAGRLVMNRHNAKRNSELMKQILYDELPEKS